MFSVLRSGRAVAITAGLCLLLSACSLESARKSSSSGGLNTPPAGSQRQTVAMQAVPTPMDSFRSLAQPQGLKMTPLFIDEVGSDEDRFKRLENSVQTLRNDLDTIVPSLVRLVAIEKDMKDLVSQLKTLTEEPAPQAMDNVEIPGEEITEGTETAAPEQAQAGTSDSSPVTPEAAPKGMPPAGAASPNSQPVQLVTPPAAPAQQPAPQKQGSAAPAPAQQSAGIVRDVRIGDHAEMTRVVMDLTARPPLSVTLQEGGKQLVIDLPGFDWQAKKEWEASGNFRLVAAYRHEGSKLIVDLAYPVTVKRQEVLNGEAGRYRLFVDIHSPQVHKP